MFRYKSLLYIASCWIGGGGGGCQQCDSTCMHYLNHDEGEGGGSMIAQRSTT